MKIAHRLLIIVCLTVTEVSITIWAALQISKGATFHQLNSLHLKYNSQFLEEVIALELGSTPNTEVLKSTITLVQLQPIGCLREVGWIDLQVMKLIGTSYALDICRRDIEDADRALQLIDDYENQKVSKPELVKFLRHTSNEFVKNSSAFEYPITKTVEFILRTMIPMIIFISLFNISLITYLSRTISGSIKHTINLLSNRDSKQPLTRQLHGNVTGELKELLDVAQERIERDLLNIETNGKLKELVDKQTTTLIAANEELEHFSYRASHDLKGPLSRSKRMCNFILEDIKNEKYEIAIKNITAVRDQMESLECLVEDLMRLAKADLVETPTEEFALQDIYQQTIEQQKSLIDENNINCVIDISEPNIILSEKTRLLQIFGNLLSNACKYSDKNKKDSWVKFSNSSDGKSYHFMVEDNGVGIPEGAGDRIFDQFERLHPHISTGSGLGLSIVQKHIRKLNGSISYQTTPSGTLFTFSLPLPELSEARPS